jgi:hypothetical protein
MTPVSGLEVQYRDHIGIIRFVDEDYITVCVSEFRDRSKDVCIVVYKEDYKNLRLLKESTK